MKEPHFSVVATSRNDDHGGNLLQRMRHFVDGFAAQCRRHGLAAELILVEWKTRRWIGRRWRTLYAGRRIQALVKSGSSLFPLQSTAALAMPIVYPCSR